ncbi:hypothetical protein CI102_9378 [Trichoderma harzianum]|uniref:Uncharacterized protein n=1 Tax=Trichoderma harzianum CBS 226.95 TaxID=983964 RepID=A0A2T4AQV3_TRIHA|nr:hypothetical protein M431DRAFT_478407 [Trichoderma harzianum CBS 226.95]PKK44785.1 hypothetical protein CI102_9378 [Trichoderma harzianum]PTB59318.1 hypothetical protein M431DRAFT_478407 [Trichoderma harzianum CBS 226.95]
MGVGETGAETLPSRPPSSGAGLGVAYFLLARIGRKTHLGQKRKESLEPATSCCLASVQSGKGRKKKGKDEKEEEDKEAKEEIPTKGKRAVIVGRVDGISAKRKSGS